jgi:hypothetical protein
MAEACYSAQASTKTQVVAEIAKLSFKKNNNRQYTHDAIATVARGIKRIMKGTYNPCDAGKGMSGLLIQNAYGPKSNDAVTPEAVLKEAKEAAEKKTMATGITATPAFIHRLEAQKEADRRNLVAQAMIGAKEGVVEALTALVGTNITDSVLRTSDGDFKSMDKYTLHEVMQAAIKNADRPPMNDVLEKIIEVLHYTFDFCKKISANMEHVQSLANNMRAYGIEVGTPAITLMLLANIETATKHKYGQEFQLAMQSICSKYVYNHKHDEKSLKVIMTELAKLDPVRTLKDAPAPGIATANSVADTIEKLKTMTAKESTNKTDGWTVVTGRKCNSNKIAMTKTNIVTLHNAYAILSLSTNPTVKSDDKEHVIVQLSKLAEAVKSTKQKRLQQQDRRKYVMSTLRRLRESEELFLDKSITRAEDE